MKIRELVEALGKVAYHKEQIATAHRRMDSILMLEAERRNTQGYIDFHERKLEKLLDQDI